MSNTIEVDGLVYGEHTIRELRALCDRQDKTIVELSEHQARANDVNRRCIQQRDESRAALAASQQEVERLRALLSSLRDLSMEPGHQLQRSYATEQWESGRVAGFRECAQVVARRIAKEGGVEP